MISISFLTGELVFTAVWLLVRIAVWIKQREIDLKREAMLLLMYINLAVIIRFVFYPMELKDGHIMPLIFDPAAVFPLNVRFIPFVNMFSGYDSQKKMLLNIIGNIAMLIPSGIVLPVLYKKLDRFWKVVLAGFMLSLCIELLQLPFYERVSDVDDLILNTLGVALGYGIYRLFRKKAK